MSYIFLRKQIMSTMKIMHLLQILFFATITTTTYAASEQDMKQEMECWNYSEKYHSDYDTINNLTRSIKARLRYCGNEVIYRQIEYKRLDFDSYFKKCENTIAKYDYIMTRKDLYYEDGFIAAITTMEQAGVIKDKKTYCDAWLRDLAIQKEYSHLFGIK